MEFNINFYKWICTRCNSSPEQVRVGASSLGELVVDWYCKKCRGRVLARIPFEELITNLPSTPITFSQEITEEDKKLLASAHIAWED